MYVCTYMYIYVLLSLFLIFSFPLSLSLYPTLPPLLVFPPFRLSPPLSLPLSLPLYTSLSVSYNKSHRDGFDASGFVYLLVMYIWYVCTHTHTKKSFHIGCRDELAPSLPQLAPCSILCVRTCSSITCTHTTAHCNTLQHTAVYFILELVLSLPTYTLQRTETHCNALHHTATGCRASCSLQNTCEWVMAHIWIIHATHKVPDSGVWMSRVTHAPSDWVISPMWMIHVTRLLGWFMSPICMWMSYVNHLHVDQSCHPSETCTPQNKTCRQSEWVMWHQSEWVVSPIWLSHVTQRARLVVYRGSAHRSHVWMSHCTQLKESCDTGCRIGGVWEICSRQGSPCSCGRLPWMLSSLLALATFRCVKCVGMNHICDMPLSRVWHVWRVMSWSEVRYVFWCATSGSRVPCHEGEAQHKTRDVFVCMTCCLTVQILCATYLFPGYVAWAPLTRRLITSVWLEIGARRICMVNMWVEGVLPWVCDLLECVSSWICDLLDISVQHATNLRVTAAAVHRNTLRCAEKHWNTLQLIQHTATHCYTLQHTLATHCNTHLQHTATHVHCRQWI